MTPAEGEDFAILSLFPLTSAARMSPMSTSRLPTGTRMPWYPTLGRTPAARQRGRAATRRRSERRHGYGRRPRRTFGDGHGSPRPDRRCQLVAVDQASGDVLVSDPFSLPARCRWRTRWRTREACPQGSTSLSVGQSVSFRPTPPGRRAPRRRGRVPQMRSTRWTMWCPPRVGRDGGALARRT